MEKQILRQKRHLRWKWQHLSQRWIQKKLKLKHSRDSWGSKATSSLGCVEHFRFIRDARIILSVSSSWN
jgi:hypothetical protein